MTLLAPLLSITIKSFPTSHTTLRLPFDCRRLPVHLPNALSASTMSTLRRVPALFGQPRASLRLVRMLLSSPTIMTFGPKLISNSTNWWRKTSITAVLLCCLSPGASTTSFELVRCGIRWCCASQTSFQSVSIAKPTVCEPSLLAEQLSCTC
eukprot:m.263846 g.263846  ORF g.263846 m.263846 type:complete len:152 (+) comp17615_c0_seq1:6737-7192(+)